MFFDQFVIESKNSVLVFHLKDRFGSFGSMIVIAKKLLID